MGITCVNQADLRANLSRLDLPNNHLQNCLDQVEAIVTRIALPAIQAFNEQRNSLVEMFTKLNALHEEEKAKCVVHKAELETQKKLATANDQTLKEESAKRARLLIEIDDMTQEIAKTRLFIDENTSIWEKHKWTIITVGAIGIATVTGVGLWAAGAFAGKAVVAAVSTKAVGLLAAKTASAHAVGPTVAFVSANTAAAPVFAVATTAVAVPAAPVIAAATARAIPAARRVLEMQAPHIPREGLENSRSSLDRLKARLEAAQKDVQTQLNTYYPTPSTPYKFTIERSDEFVNKLNSKCSKFPPNELMKALYETSFVDPANPIISRLYKKTTEGTFETLATRLNSSIRQLETDARIPLCPHGKIFLTKALTLKWVLDKIKHAGNEMSNLTQTFETARNTEQGITNLRESQQTIQRETNDQINKIAAQKLKLNELKERITTLEENNKITAARLIEVRREAERIRAELTQRVG